VVCTVLSKLHELLEIIVELTRKHIATLVCHTFSSDQAVRFTILKYVNVAYAMPVFSQRYPQHLLSQPALLQVMTFLLDLAGVCIAHAVDSTLAGYTKSVLISPVWPLML